MIMQKAAVFLTPITPPITSILGSDRVGPAKSSESAGPLPIPAPIKPWRIGTSVRVAKYINAPETETKRFAIKEFPLPDSEYNVPELMCCDPVCLTAELTGRQHAGESLSQMKPFMRKRAF